MFESFRYLMKLLLFTMICLSFSCKVDRKKSTAETNSSSSTPTSLKNMANQSESQINPDEAIVTIRINKIKSADGLEIIVAQVIKLNKVSFGFNSIINSGDEIKITNPQKIALDAGQELKCVISAIIKPNMATSMYKLIKLI